MCIVTFPRVPHEGPDNFTPQVKYEYNQHKLIGLKGELGKYLKNNGYCNIYYEKNYKASFKVSVSDSGTIFLCSNWFYR